MADDAYADRLAAVAVEMVGRVRTDSPDENATWLRAELPDPADREALLFVLAAAVPDNRPWKHLTAWAHTQTRRIARCGTTSGHTRHITAKEEPCDPCKEARSTYDRLRYRDRQQAVDSPVHGLVSL